MFFRISLIVATDMICWLPIIFFSFRSFFGYPVPDIVHSFTSIIILPINSLINPIIYSKLDVIFVNALKNLNARFSKQNETNLKKNQAVAKKMTSF